MSKFSIFNFQFSIKAGFTLVELLVVFAIIFVGSTVSIVSFRQFGDARTLEVAAAEVESLLNSARISAVTQTFPRQPVVCNSNLQRYSVRMTSSTAYEMDVYCSGIRSTITTKALPRGVTFTAVPYEISFVAARGTSPVAGTITLNGMYGSKQITIDTAGNITKL